MGTPNREPPEHSRNDPSGYMPIISLLHSWASLLGIPMKVPLKTQSVHPSFERQAQSKMINRRAPSYLNSRLLGYVSVSYKIPENNF